MTTSRATIPLILFTLALSFAAVALIVNGALQAPTIEEISASCGEKFFASQEPATCPEPLAPEASMLTVTPSASRPGFSYPAGWNAIETTSVTELGTKTTITLATAGIFTFCETCTKGALATIVTEPFALTGTETLDSFVQAQYASIPNAVIQKAVLGNGTKYTVSGVSSGASPGPFMDILFFGATAKVTVLFPESSTLSGDALEKSALIGSLDFSLIL